MTMPGDQAKPGTAPNDGVRGLLAIAFGWTVLAAVAVAGIGIVRPPVTPSAADGWGSWGLGLWGEWDESRAGIDLEDPAFRIISVNGEPAHRVDMPEYTVRSAPAVLEIEVLKDEDVECWADPTFDSDWIGDPGTSTVRIDLEAGDNTFTCYSDGVTNQADYFVVVYEPDGTSTALPGEPTVPPTPRPGASAEPDLFEITSIDGRHPGSAAGGSFTVHQPTVRIDIDQRTPATVTCDNLDAGWLWETDPRVADQYLEIILQPGVNAITCRAGKGPVQEVRFDVEFIVDPTPSADPDAVVITTVDGWARNTVPDYGYTTLSKQIILRGSAPDPDAVVCTGAACEGADVFTTGATTWAVQLELAEGTNRVEVHAENDPSNSDRITVELIP